MQDKYRQKSVQGHKGGNGPFRGWDEFWGSFMSLIFNHRIPLSCMYAQEKKKKR